VEVAAPVVCKHETVWCAECSSTEGECVGSARLWVQKAEEVKGSAHVNARVCKACGVCSARSVEKKHPHAM